LDFFAVKMLLEYQEQPMIKIEFTPEEIDTLAYERYHYPDPKVQKKLDVLYLKSMGLEHQEICKICRISKTTLTTYLRQYQDGGLEKLKETNYVGQPSELQEHETTLKEYFEKHPPQTSAEAMNAIEKLTGLKRSPTQVRAFMRRIGMRCRMVGYVPGKAANPEKQAEQETFRSEQLETVLEEAKAGQRVALFMDAAHFVQGAVLGKIWCFVRLFIASPSGRNRFNVLGALNAVTKEVLTITNETYINSESVCLLLAKIALHYAGKPITIFLDNARYQRCQLVQNYAAALGITLVFLPSYSPNLNLIERYWRFVRKNSLYSKYYEHFADFKDAIANLIDTAHVERLPELETLLTWNFQSFTKVQISTV
jgi:transposase